MIKAAWYWYKKRCGSEEQNKVCRDTFSHLSFEVKEVEEVEEAEKEEEGRVIYVSMVCIQ